MTGRRIRSIIAAALTLAILAIAGCGSLGGEKSADDTVSVENAIGSAEAPMAEYDGVARDMAAEESVTSPTSSDVAVDATDRLIIRNKTMRIEVEKVNEAVTAIERLAAEHDAVITAMQIATDDETPVYRYDEITYSDTGALRGYVTVRVPADSYEAFLTGVNGIGTVLYQAENADDVTQQHVDMSARLDNLRAEEIRLREFFDAANKVEEMLAIERELSRVRGEIESLDAQVKYLERQAAMATVTIDLTEPKPLVRPSGDDWGFGDAVTNGFRGAAGVIQVAIALIIGTAPLWILALIAFFIVRAVLRRRTRKNSTASATGSEENVS